MQGCLGPYAQLDSTDLLASCGQSLLLVDWAWNTVLVPNDGGLAAEQAR